MSKHYHVIMGMCGYMPDVNDIYQSRRDAVDGANWWLEEILDDHAASYNYAPDAPNVTIAGKFSKRGDSSVQIDTEPSNPYHIPTYIEVSECFDTSCESDD